MQADGLDIVGRWAADPGLARSTPADVGEPWAALEGMSRYPDHTARTAAEALAGAGAQRLLRASTPAP